MSQGGLGALDEGLGVGPADRVEDVVRERQVLDVGHPHRSALAETGQRGAAAGTERSASSGSSITGRAGSRPWLAGDWRSAA